MRNPNGSAIPAVWNHPELDGRVTALTREKAGAITGLDPAGFKRTKQEGGMNREEIGRMALERLCSTMIKHGMATGHADGWDDLLDTLDGELKRVRSDERERCARLAEGGNFLHDDAPAARFGRECATAIRKLR